MCLGLGGREVRQEVFGILKINFTYFFQFCACLTQALAHFQYLQVLLSNETNLVWEPSSNIGPTCLY